MRKFLFVLLLPFLGFSGITEDLMLGPTKADDITYNWLVQGAVKEHDSQHVMLFKRLFQLHKVKTLMEFGLGYPTKFFLDNCNKVISIDVITHGYGPGIMQKFLKIYSDYSNWIPISFFSGYRGWDFEWAPYKHMGSDAVYKATSYQHAYHKNYAKIDDFYLVELNAFITNLLKYNKTEAAFIGHAIFLRGDLVQLLFDRVPIIIAHNSRARMLELADDIYGLNRVVTPENYEEIYFDLEGGTTAWIMKKEGLKGLIQELQKYADEI